MDKVLDNSGKYENVITEHNPVYEQLKASIPIVKEFIRNRKLLIYGGTAIDYALRLKGDCIYPDEMLDIPDLDLKSSQHVEDAYDLTDILYQLGNKNVYAWRGFYMLVMHVGFTGINELADLGFVPKEIFDHIPYIEYEGMRVTHPHYQMIDTHSSLSFPFDGAESNYGEILFNRWKKDIVRYNKLYHHYPLPIPKQTDILASSTVAIDAKFGNIVFMGFAAYALLYNCAELLSETSGVALPKNVIPAEFKIHDDHIHFTTIGSEIHFIHHTIEDFAKEYLKDSNITYYKPYKDIIPYHLKGKIADDITNNDIIVNAYSTENRLVGVASVKIASKKLRMVSAQHILMFMLIRYHKLDGKQSSTANAYYLSILNMIKFAEEAVSELSKKAGNKSDEVKRDLILNSPFFPSLKSYGKDNVSEAGQYIKYLALEKIDGTRPPAVPARYEPEKHKVRPKFDYSKSIYFNRIGQEISK